MKGVISGLAPRARVVDLTHEIPPQDVVAAAFQLWISQPYFPEGAIHVAVVDPDVGTERRPLLLETSRALFLAPDNGLLGPVADHLGGKFRAITNRGLFLPEVSATFHGRDVFAPVAARLACGLSPAEVGPVILDAQRLSWREPEFAGRTVRGEVLHVDRYGNLVTNLPNELAPRLAELRVAATGRGGRARIVGLGHTYRAGNPGRAVVVPGSSGFLEVAVYRGSAAQKLRASRGTGVEGKLCPS